MKIVQISLLMSTAVIVRLLFFVLKLQMFRNLLTNCVISSTNIPTSCTCHKVYFCLRTVVHVSGVTITYLQEHKTTVTTVSGNHYTVRDRVKFYW